MARTIIITLFILVALCSSASADFLNFSWMNWSWQPVATGSSGGGTFSGHIFVFANGHAITLADGNVMATQ